ncbi:hypothetical protein VTN77DRAFT_3597 [Rasamsonia byssochlamydoides]|uniref:uncharacterized protein n=1 Tax=Rasamsonia byssochlamydoides TaxID=89139 RepID=UPI00374336A9
MRSFTLLSLLCTLLVLATLTTAWQWPDAVNGEDNRLEKRAAASSTTQASETSTSASSTESGSSTTAAAASSTTQSGSSTTESGSSATQTGSTTTEKGKTSKGTKTTAAASSTSIFVDPRLPPGGISMITPATTTTTYYKIGNYVTFAWNYTSLSVTPSAIDVIASCSLNSATYTLTSNMSVAPTGAVTWDTNKYQATATVPLLTASYTLIIYEAGTNPSDVASAGHLGASNFIFGMYLPQPYTPLNEYVCATCNAAMSDTERQALGFVLTMVTITVLSFTWFAGGFGVFSS